MATTKRRRMPTKKQAEAMPLRVRYNNDPVFKAKCDFNEGPMVSSIEPGDKELDEDGSWIIVLMPPNCEYTVEPLSIFFAVPDTSGQRYKARINTPKGPLWLWPHEYMKVGNVSEYITMLGDDEEHAKINYMSERTELAGDKLFYLRSRGIPYADAVMMLLGDVKDPNFCYLTFPRWIQRELAGVGVPGLGARAHVEGIIARFEREEVELENS